MYYLDRYGFFGRLKSEFPSQIVVDVTDSCNLACIHCPHSVIKKSGNIKASHLALELNEKMVDEVNRYGKGITEYIRYTSNGEPLLHPHILTMLEHAVRKSGTLVAITTNGSLLNEKKCEAMLDMGLHIIDISIDAYSHETYSKIRINGDFDVMRLNVHRLLDMRREKLKKIKIVVSFVEQEKNKHEAKLFEDYWKSHGVDYVVIRRLHTATGYISHASNKNDCQPERRPCLYPWERMVLTSNGFLSFCPNAWEGKADMSDYRLVSIKDVWQSEYYNKLRAAHLDNDYTDHELCKNCTDWKETRWPHEGRSYSDMVRELKE